METTDDLVREIADREAIRDLSARYCDCIWRKDVDGLVSLFTEDGTFRVEGLEVEASSHGRAQLRKMYEQALEELDPRLFFHSQIVDLLGGNRATGRCYVELFSAKYDMERVGLGYYEDQYTKIGGEWKFASRRYFLDSIDTTVPLRRTFMV
jgi:ketosteroid isomerase-like protein